MARATFPAGSVTNTTGRPMHVRFFLKSNSTKPVQDLMLPDSGGDDDGVAYFVVGTDGAYPSFLGPDDGSSVLWVEAGPGGTRTQVTGSDPALSGTYAALEKAVFRAGRKWMFAGTSITSGTGAPNTIYGYVFQALHMAGTWYASRGSVQAGTPGITVAAQLAGLPAKLAANPPDALFIETGPNDATDATATSLASFQASVVAMVALGKQRNIPVVVATPTPFAGSAATATAQARVIQQAAWIRLWAQSAGVVVADFNAAISDPTTGLMLSAYNSDDVHPNRLGHQRLALVAADAMRYAMPPGLHSPVLYKGSGLATNPLMVSAGITPTGSYAETSTGDAPTVSMEADATGRLAAGQWAKEVWTPVASAVTYNRVISTVAGGASTWAVGDAVALSAYVEVTDVASRWEADVAAGTAAINVSARSASVNFVAAWDPSAGRRLGGGVYALGPCWSTGIIPASGLQDLRYDVKLPVGAAVTVRFGCIELINLTKLGLLVDAASPVAG